MADDVLKSFLVSVGFKVDKEGERKVVEAVGGITKMAGTLALALEAAAVAAAAAVTKIASAFDTLYFVSQRTGASVQNIKGLAYAFGQVGGSGAGAVSAIESFAKAMRTNPGVQQFVKDLGVATTVNGKARDSVTVLSEAIDAIQKKNPYYVGAQIAGLLGIDEGTYNTLVNYRKEIKEFRAEYDRTARTIGLNNEAAAAASNKFMTSLRSLSAAAQAVAEKVGSELAPVLTKYLDAIRDWITRNPEAIEKAIRQIIEAAVALAKAFGDIVAALTPLAVGFQHMAETLTGKEGLQASFEVFAAFLVGSWLVRILGAFAKVRLGWVALLAAIGLDVLKNSTPEGRAKTIQEGEEAINREQGGASGGQRGWVGRGWDWLKKKTGLGGGDSASAGTQARSPEASGRYRPVYNLTDADLDQKVVNTIAGEVSTKNAEGVDAVINNMLNRVGSKGWGPSGNLLEVARAKGQYAGYRAAGEAESEFVRARIRAIASGGVPDNTGGANSYRAAWYGGPWAQKHAADGTVIGGNRFAFEKGFPNGPYAPYANPAPATPSIPSLSGGMGAVRALGSASAMGSASGGTSNSISMEHSTTINVNGTGDPATVANRVESSQNRVNDLSLRNAQTAIR